MKYLLFLLLPKELLSRFLGVVERLESPQWFVRLGKTWFVRRYKLNMSEAEKPIEEYPSLNALFTRKLKPGLRPIRAEVVQPCDAVISQCGPLKEDMLLQAKGWTYSASELVGEDFKEGYFATYYLCPTDYHRVHFPLSGEVLKVSHVKGKLWPVNEWSVHHVKNLFCLNERVIFKMKTTMGVVYMVMVGATNVGQITTSLVPELHTNLCSTRESKTYDFSSEPIKVRVGEEAGIFQMGSTVILLTESNLKWQKGSVQLGQSLI